ncbi:MAG: SRPBCC family protein [Cyclobacteriaceae bacterium]|nr:SRPBCC family protein [Cyclobacteriaceae bacterium]
MKVYTLKRKQILPISINEAWEFFSTPSNLTKITPEHMGFKILYISGGPKMYAGQLIRYIVYGLPGIPMNWTTEITHVQEPYYFVDEQRFGPYALWHHQHHFKEVAGGIEMTDEVNYAVPFGIIGRMANWLFVERELNRIFDFRYKVLETYFKQPEP